jgi:putative DNA primase/helicase
MSAINALEELKARPQWVAWRIEQTADGKPTKVPYVATNGKHADSTDPATWAEFAIAARAYKAAGHRGLGFVVTLDGPYCGVDLDHCRDPETGEIAAWAMAIIKRFDSYTEITPSKTGLRIWIKARKSGAKCAKPMGDGKVEIYDHARFFTVTGEHLEGTPTTIEDRQAEYDALYAELWPEPAADNRSARPSSSRLTAYEILELARDDKNAAKWDRLMRGDLSDYNGDDSRADGGLCALAAFYTDDPGVIDQIVRMSGLWRDKWTERPDYRERTISGALQLVAERYEPASQSNIRHRLPPAAVALGPDGADKPYALALDDFIALQLDARPPLIGTEDDNILPAGGLLILVAKGGKGKTTLTIEMALHAASGVDWLDFRIERPLRVLIIENEGPIKPFQRKLGRRRKRWGREIAGAVFIKYLDWGAFRIDGEGQAQRLRAFIEQEQIDLVVGDPLGSLGLKGVGSPEDTRELMAHLVSVGLTRDVAFWLLHHPRKEVADDEIDEASGDWQGKPDTMLKLSLLPGNRSRLSFPKVRWGAVGSRSAYILAFDPETETFSVAGRETDDDRDLVAEIRALFADGGWRIVKEIAAPRKPKDGAASGIGANVDVVKKTLADHPADFVSCSGKDLGRSPLAILWNLAPQVPEPTPPNRLSPPSPSSPLPTSGGEKERTDSRTRPYIEVGRSESVHSPVSEPTDLAVSLLSPEPEPHGPFTGPPRVRIVESGTDYQLVDLGGQSMNAGLFVAERRRLKARRHSARQLHPWWTR